MKEKFEWVKEHKKEILIGVGTIAGTAALTVIGVKRYKLGRERRERMLDELTGLACNILSNGIDKHYGLDLEAVPIKNLGKVGENFLKNVPGSKDDTLVQVIAYINKENLV